MTVPSPSSSANAWPDLRRLYPVYSALAREFVIEMQPCRELEEAPDVPSAAAIPEAEKWVTAMDQRIHPHQLRQFVQTSASINEEVLQDLLVHHLRKKPHTDPDRDKVDFLLVQLFSQRVPSHFSDSDLSFKAVADLLEPVLGGVVASEPKSLAPLNNLLAEADRAKNLNWLFTNRIIERGRGFKHSCGEKFFDPAALVAFARFGFLIRRRFFRLMHQDLNAILEGLRELEARGITTLDCRKAQFAADEPIARLRMICQSWKVMFHAEYSSGQPLCILVDLRTAVEAALTQSPRPREPQLQLKTKAAAATDGRAVSSGHAPEFEVSGGSASWNPDGSEP